MKKSTFVKLVLFGTVLSVPSFGQTKQDLEKNKRDSITRTQQHRSHTTTRSSAARSVTSSIPKVTYSKSKTTTTVPKITATPSKTTSQTNSPTTTKSSTTSFSTPSSSSSSVQRGGFGASSSSRSASS